MPAGSPRRTNEDEGTGKDQDRSAPAVPIWRVFQRFINSISNCRRWLTNTIPAIVKPPKNIQRETRVSSDRGRTSAGLGGLLLPARLLLSSTALCNLGWPVSVCGLQSIVGLCRVQASNGSPSVGGPPICERKRRQRTANFRD